MKTTSQDVGTDASITLLRTVVYIALNDRFMYYPDLCSIAKQF